MHGLIFIFFMKNGFMNYEWHGHIGKHSQRYFKINYMIKKYCSTVLFSIHIQSKRLRKLEVYVLTYQHPFEILQQVLTNLNTHFPSL